MLKCCRAADNETAETSDNGGQPAAASKFQVKAISLEEALQKDLVEDGFVVIEDVLQHPEEVRGFIEELAREATRFTAVLYQTAWHLSGKMVLPDWFDLEKIDVN